MNEHKQIRDDKRSELEPKRYEYAVKMIEKQGLTITHSDNKKIMFLLGEHKVSYFPYTGWATSKAITDGRGIKHLLTEITKYRNGKEQKTT